MFKGVPFILPIMFSYSFCAEGNRENSIDTTSMRKPLRIRVVNYDPFNEEFVERYMMKKNARRQFREAGDIMEGTYSGRSYLREVRKRMRPGEPCCFTRVNCIQN